MFRVKIDSSFYDSELTEGISPGSKSKLRYKDFITDISLVIIVQNDVEHLAMTIHPIGKRCHW